MSCDLPFKLFKNQTMGNVSITKLSLVPILALVNLFLLFNVGAFVPADQVGKYQNLIIVYSLALVIARVFIPGRAKFTQERDIGLNIFLFFLGLVLTTLFLKGIQNLPNFGISTYIEFAAGSVGAIALIQAVTQVSIVAYVEEYIFRGMLPKYIPGFVGIVLSQLAFGFFHYFAYAGSLGTIFIAVIAGFVFYGAARLSNSLYLAVGMHAAYNLVLMGVV